MKILWKIVKYTLITTFSLLLMVLIFGTIMYWSADMKQPGIMIDTTTIKVADHAGFSQCDSAKLRQNNHGIWELYIEGDAVHRGLTMGALTSRLLKYQEDVFVGQIRQIIPSDRYLNMLRIMLISFNRNLGKHIPDEYREEIYAISQYCTNEYDAIGTPYERQLNYHAAHDIGHTMQQYMLVGCSSFAAWGAESEDSTLIIGRNFDFYVGDDFAKNKIVMFFAPDNGYKFASVSWAGMIGVLSGMNEAGLTVTINAAKGSIPITSATPISILVREILQYASTIEEAYEIAEKRKTFVNESILVASAKDGYAAVIEKTTNKIDIYKGDKQHIVCTNHYQSPLLANEEYNIENINTTDSKYRHERLTELIKENTPVSAVKAAKILRNRYGKGGEDVGMGNEMTLNQSIAHHSVIFQPEKRLMYVSTEPWQAGEYICYDLGKVFSKRDFSNELNLPEYTIAKDSILFNYEFPAIVEYRKKVKEVRYKAKHDRQSCSLSQEYIHDFVTLNPRFYNTYKVLGDYYYSLSKEDCCASDKILLRYKSVSYYKQALTCKIPIKSAADEIEKQIEKLNKR